MNKYQEALETLSVKIMVETDQSEESRAKAIAVIQELIDKEDTFQACLIEEINRVISIYASKYSQGVVAGLKRALYLYRHKGEQK